jgi:hypothetical protein
MAAYREWMAGALSALVFGSVACGKSAERSSTTGGGSSGSSGTAGASGGKGGTAGRGGGTAGTGVGGTAGTAGGKAGSAGTAGRTDPGSGGEGGEDVTGAGSGGKAGAAGAGAGGASGTGGDGGKGGEMGSNPLSPLIDAFCAAARACCALAGEPEGALVTCEQQAAATNGNVALVAGGTVEVDSAALSACVSAFEAAATGCVLTDVLTACRGILRGTLDDGDACADVMECDRSAGPMVCKKLQQGTADPDIGVCTPPPRGTLGDPCGSSCEEGQECSTTSSSPDDTYPITFCFEADGLYCPLGESCAAIVPDGGECSYDQTCGSDGFCLSSCEPLADEGDTCQFNYGCQAGLACVAGECAREPFANGDTCIGHPPSFY